ncbi:MAG: DNA polymerase-3 subunit alpha [Planctomycetota bacterium]|jgi:DNA polymerase-3 subunit alpha
MAFDGARKRYRPMLPEVLGRLDYELSTLQNLGFAPYFLLVERIAAFAKAEHIPHVGRGSAADSLVAYCLELTDADPLRYKLPFERFLNPGRKDRPDVDLDFCWRRRDEVLQHVFDLFGHQRTAMISTLNRFGARSAFREAALARGIPPAEFQRWSHRIPMYDGLAAGAPTVPFSGTAESLEAGEVVSEKISGESRHSGGQEELTHPGSGGGGGGPADPKPANPLAATLRNQPETKDFPFHDPRFAAALNDAAKLLETPRHFGLHPGGVVVSPNLITDHLSCAPSAKGPVVTQLDKDGVEALGLVKMDLLGNRALTTLQDTLDSLSAQGIHVDLESLPEDDPETATLLRQGRTLGCFQIESPGMRHLLQQTGACTMDDVIQAVALIRPGPAQAGMKDAYVRRFRKLEKPDPPHPSLRETLAETQGIMLYQEDVMHVAAKAAGMDLPTADKLRRALQKRRLTELPELHAQFNQGCARNGWTEAEIQDVWQLIEGFASFAFCKAHAVTYGRIAYRAAWLKAHHPVEYITAFLNSLTGYYAARVYVEEARRLGAKILGPDINRSLAGFHVERPAGTRRPDPTHRGRLRMGLSLVHGLSQQTLHNILEAREQQPFLSLPDFLERSEAHTDEADHLIRSGALDSFDHTRPELLWRLHLLRRSATRPPRGANLNLDQWNACRPGTDPIFESPSAGWSGQGLGLQATRLSPGEQVPLFSEPPDTVPVMPGLPDWDGLKRGRSEHELLGVTLNAHPSQLFPCPGEMRMRAAITSPADRRAPMPPLSCADLPSRTGARITLRAWLAASRRVHTKDGQWMRFLTLEDPSGIAEAVLFPNIYKQTADRVRSDETLLVTGTIEDQMGAHLLRVEHVW